MMIHGGITEDGRRFIDYGPMLKDVWAIMVKLDGEWKPYKIFNSDNNKIYKRAKKIIRTLKVDGFRSTMPQVKFKLEKIWTTTDEHERRIVYYDTQDQVQDAIREAGFTGPYSSEEDWVQGQFQKEDGDNPS